MAMPITVVIFNKITVMRFCLLYNIIWSELYTNTYRLLKRTRCSACMSEAFKACITASFMHISAVSAWRLRQKRLCACHTGSHAPQSPTASKKKTSKFIRTTKPARCSPGRLLKTVFLRGCPCFLRDHLPSLPFQQPIRRNCFSPICLVKTISHPFSLPRN